MKDQETDQARWFVDVVLPHEKDLRNWLVVVSAVILLLTPVIESQVMR